MQGNAGNLLEDGCIVEFRMGSVKDDIASLKPEEGKKLYPEKPAETFRGVPTFKDAIIIEIRIPGNKDEIIETEAWLDESKPGSHLNRFPLAWARFKARQEAGPGGFPLSEWAAVTRSQVDNLAYLNIKTVEQLAIVSDANLQHIMGGTDLRKKAQEFLAQRNSRDTMREELEALKAQFAALQKSEPSGTKLTVIPAAAAAAMSPPTQESQGETAQAEQPRRRRGRPSKAEQTQP